MKIKGCAKHEKSGGCPRGSLFRRLAPSLAGNRNLQNARKANGRDLRLSNTRESKLGLPHIRFPSEPKPVAGGQSPSTERMRSERPGGENEKWGLKAARHARSKRGLPHDIVFPGGWFLVQRALVTFGMNENQTAGATNERWK